LVYVVATHRCDCQLGLLPETVRQKAGATTK